MENRMRHYLIKGIIGFKKFCACGYCKGHDRILRVNDLAEADSEEMALRKLREGHTISNHVEYAELDDVVITLLPDDLYEKVKDEYTWKW